MIRVRSLFVASLAACAAVPAACAFWPGDGGTPPRRELGAGEDGVAYVDDATCADCHAPEHAAWSGSHHDLAMQEATVETVLGDFDDATFTHFGVTSRFFMRDGRFLVNTEGPDGRLADFELAYTFGVEPLQQYLAPFPGGRLQSLTIAWDTERGAWIHLYPDEPIPPGDPLHWTGRYQRWNVMCAECHSTHLRPNYDVDSDTYRTTWAAMDIGCQACHGPGALHVDWARAAPQEIAALPPPSGASRSAVIRRPSAPGRARPRQRSRRQCECRAPGLRRLPLPAPAPHCSRSSRASVSRRLPAGEARRRALLSGWTDPGRGLRLGIIRPEPDARGGGTLHGLSRSPPARRARRGRRGLSAMPPADAGGALSDAPAGPLRHAGPPLPPAGLGRGALRELPHARADLHAGRSAPRSRLPHSAPRPVGGAGHPERLHAMP